MFPGKTNAVHFFVVFFFFPYREKIIYGKIQQPFDNLYLFLRNKILMFLRHTSKELKLYSSFLSNKKILSFKYLSPYFHMEVHFLNYLANIWSI